MQSVAANLQQVSKLIIAAEQRFARALGTVKLLAVSKSQPIEKIEAAITAGQYAFGENYVQEALTKIAEIKHPAVEWHFIGAIQSNKTKAIAEHFTWAHSVTSLKAAEKLNQYRSTTKTPLNICVEVNVDEENSKNGVSLTEIEKLISAIIKLPNLKLRGLMAIPAAKNNFEEQRKSFHKLKIAYEKLQEKGFNLDTLSMGMSADFAAAIAEGSTMVRLGTAIFGERKK